MTPAAASTTERQTAIARRAPPDAELDLRTLGDVFARSGYFDDAKQAGQAMVKILYGRELGIAPVTAMMGIHIIQGKPSASAGLLAGRIRASQRYDYRVKQLTNEACTIEFLDRGKVAGESTFTIEDAKTAGVYTGKNAHTWKSYARNMLFARALSNGARWYCPDVFGGSVYTPEEMGAEVDGEGNVAEATYAVVDPEAERRAALQAWEEVVARAAKACVQHKPLGEDAPTSKIVRWTAVLLERVQGAEAPPDPTPAAAAAEEEDDDPLIVTAAAGHQVDTTSGEVVQQTRSQLWQENRRLVARAQELKLTGVPTLNTRATDNVLVEANTTLAARIRRAEDLADPTPDDETIGVRHPASQRLAELFEKAAPMDIDLEPFRVPLPAMLSEVRAASHGLAQEITRVELARGLNL
jgi:hypothetical protein